MRYVAAWFASISAAADRHAEERMAWASSPRRSGRARGGDRREHHREAPGRALADRVFLAVFGVLLWLADRMPQERKLDDLRFGRP